MESATSSGASAAVHAAERLRELNADGTLKNPKEILADLGFSEPKASDFEKIQKFD